MNNLSNISYTNKDFNAIYPELLDYAKMLSYKWDPSASSESDPGVVLLKLLAIVADKNNYNIDKNILELLPSSVTQASAARQIFEQCGYVMKYNQSATTELNVTVMKNSDEEFDTAKTVVYNLPRFVMFTDVDSSIVYTSTKPANLALKQTQSVPVIEGTVSDLVINNETTITYDLLDSKNRVYFSDRNIAENGIFITNVNKDNYDEWYLTDSLETESPNSLCYKFGVSIDSEACFIEFPEDVADVIGEGINIKYIKTSGKQGNISTRRISYLFSDISVDVVVDGTTEENKTITNDILSIYNPLGTNNGVDAESIDAAYKNYKRVKNTFKTLVSLHDYTDYMMSSECASNGYVCDRTNDIQHSYRVSKAGASNRASSILNYKVEKTRDADGNYTKEDSMNAFDLCVYALSYVPNVDSEEYYKKTFELISKTPENHIYVKHLNDDNIDLKCLQHDFKEFEENTILMIKNKYPINATIIPVRKLSLTEQFEIKDAVRKALYNSLNSKEMSFGEQVSYDVIYDSIINADSRIRAASVQYPVYETYAVYLKDNTLHEMRIDDESHSGGYVLLNASDAKNSFPVTQDKPLFYLDEEQIKPVAQSESYDKSLKYFKFDNSLHKLWVNFIVEIFAKNITRNTTPLYTQDSTFTYSLTQDVVKVYDEVSTVTTKTNITGSTSANNEYTYEVSKNESIVLTSPELVTENNFSSYVKVAYNITGVTTIDANTIYELKDNDFLVFFWKASDTDNYYTYCKYDNSEKSLAKYFSCNIALATGNNILNDDKKDQIQDSLSNLSSGKGKIYQTETERYNYIKSLTTTKQTDTSGVNLNVLNGTNSINTYNIKSIKINNTTNGSTHIYWILNEYDSKDPSKYRSLFPEGKTEYTLKSGEYFLYTNADQTALYLLGEGTHLKINNTGSAHDLGPVDAIGYDELLQQGIDALSPFWRRIQLKDEDCVIATEMRIIQLGPQSSLYIKFNNNTTDDTSELHTGNSNITDIYKNLNTCVERASYKASDDDSTTETDIELRHSRDLCWKVYSVLNIVSGPDKVQELTENQCIVIGGEEITGTSVLTDRDVSFVGGENVDLTSYMSGLLKTQPIQMLQFNNMGESTANPPQYKVNASDFSITLMYQGSQTTNTETISLQPVNILPGNYLLHLYCETPEKIESISIARTETKANTNTDKLQFEFDKLFTQNNYLWKMSVTEKTLAAGVSPTLPTISVTVTHKQADGTSVNLIIQPLVKYTTRILDDFTSRIQENEQYSDSTFEKLLIKRLNELDPDGEVDYTNIANTAISNPVVNTSFFNTRHHYNQFTICQWHDDSIGGDGLDVTNNIK